MENIYIAGPTYVLQPQTVEFSEDLTYEEFPIVIVDRQTRQLYTKEIPMIKVLWSNHSAEDCTCETEAMMWETYPYFFSILICTSFIP